MSNLPIPPNSPEAEMAVLGSMMIEKEATERALEILDESHFHVAAHRTIFRVLEALNRADKAIDLVTVGEELSRIKQLDTIGGMSVLTDMLHKVATAAHVEHYARIVHDKAVLRELIRTASSILQDCYSEKEPTLLLDEAQAQIMTVAQRQTANKFADTKEMMQKAIEHMELLHKNKNSVTGVATGFKQFDSMTAGLHPGNLILIAGRPGHGKTSLAMNIAVNIIMKSANRSVAFFSMEMDKSDIACRLISCQAGISMQKVRSGYFKREQWGDLTSAAARLAETSLFVDDSAGLSVLEVRGRARRLANDLRKKGKPLSLIIIDYLQLMHGSSRRTENRQQEVAEISRGLKFLARDLGIPVIALSQLSRRVEDKARSDGRPQLSDLRDSGSLEQDADVVAFIFREAASRAHDLSLDPKKAEIILAKQRQGPTGVVHVHFDPELTRFGNLDATAEEPWHDEQASFT
ncbi:MAG: replicative DNA helicase [Elusimicrobia bacterium RBG_16_66_12]|nr:MAG: replicative DNA helicase [Elusimicrobia bacterium RBG_16_66_12]